MNTYADDHAKPCPFCGQGAITEEYLAKWNARCGSKDCVVNPCTDGMHSEAEAVAAWNTRAEVQS